MTLCNFHRIFVYVKADRTFVLVENVIAGMNTYKKCKNTLHAYNHEKDKCTVGQLRRINARSYSCFNYISAIFGNHFNLNADDIDVNVGAD